MGSRMQHWCPTCGRYAAMEYERVKGTQGRFWRHEKCGTQVPWATAQMKPLAL